jgi:hypothetical protein
MLLSYVALTSDYYPDPARYKQKLSTPIQRLNVKKMQHFLLCFPVYRQRPQTTKYVPRNLTNVSYENMAICTCT